eukprot:scaffold47102_cov40-Tisochrysis_lutea.AAC.1
MHLRCSHAEPETPYTPQAQSRREQEQRIRRKTKKSAPTRLLASRLLERPLLVHPAVELRPGNLAWVEALEELGLALAVDEAEGLLIRPHVEDAVPRVDPQSRVGADL